MIAIRVLTIWPLSFLLFTCGRPGLKIPVAGAAIDTVNKKMKRPVNNAFSPMRIVSSSLTVETANTTPRQLISFAGSLIGIPYKYASTDPAQGFDCSGFITYVFNHFGIAVPRSSVDFTAIKHEVPLENARPGDLILFTGTDSRIRTVGHMGIVIQGTADGLKFIHATSGKAYGVTITPFNPDYQKRFVKIVRVFP